MALPFSDNCNRADGGMGANYAAGVGGGLAIVSNQAHGGGGGVDYISYNTSETYANDQKVSAAVWSAGGGFKSGVACRCSGAGATFAGVGVRLDDAVTAEIHIYSGGVDTFFGAVTVTTWTDGVILEAQLAGTTLKVFRAGVQQGSDQDLSGAGIPSGGAAGWYAFNIGVVDDLGADNLSGGAPGFPPELLFPRGREGMLYQCH